jgi:hypothetical protein
MQLRLRLRGAVSACFGANAVESDDTVGHKDIFCSILPHTEAIGEVYG